MTVLDKLTYAGNLESLAPVRQDSRCRFVCYDIVDNVLVRRLLDELHPGAIVHFAAESHVDRSILGSAEFILCFVKAHEVESDASDRRDFHAACCS